MSSLKEKDWSMITQYNCIAQRVMLKDSWGFPRLPGESEPKLPRREA